MMRAMMRTSCIVLLGALAATAARAEDRLVPASAAMEDLEAFDRSLEAAKPASADFGATVTEEARKLKDSDVGARKGYGASVSERKRSALSDGAGPSETQGSNAGRESGQGGANAHGNPKPGHGNGH